MTTRARHKPARRRGKLWLIKSVPSPMPRKRGALRRCDAEGARRQAGAASLARDQAAADARPRPGNRGISASPTGDENENATYSPGRRPGSTDSNQDRSSDGTALPPAVPRLCRPRHPGYRGSWRQGASGPAYAYEQEAEHHAAGERRPACGAPGAGRQVRQVPALAWPFAWTDAKAHAAVPRALACNEPARDGLASGQLGFRRPGPACPCRGHRAR